MLIVMVMVALVVRVRFVLKQKRKGDEGGDEDCDDGFERNVIWTSKFLLGLGWEDFSKRHR